jgi:hypothetical protein
VSRRTSQLGLLDKSLFVLGHLGQRGVAIESESKIGFHNSVGFRLLAIIRQSLGAKPCHASFGLGLAHRTFVQIKGTKNFPNRQNIKLFLPSPRVRATNDDNEKTAPRVEHTCFLRPFAFSPTEKIVPKRKNVAKLFGLFYKLLYICRRNGRVMVRVATTLRVVSER